jgi:propanol-preferring alcohol dehydrogenase
MKAARLHAYGASLVIEDVPTPTPDKGQVVIKIEGAGFCHSDVHVIDGDIRVLPRMPITLGHENAGRVVAVGTGVQTVAEDDPVAVYGGWGCGVCDHCVTGHEQLCDTPQWAGLSQHDGGYAEYLLVPHERYLVKLQRLKPEEAAPLTDAALTPYRAIRKAQPFLQADHHVLVIGVGGLGQYGLKLLRLLSGCPIIAVDVSDQKLRLARELGADVALDARTADIAADIKEFTGGQGVAAAFDFVGSDATLALAIGSTRALGKVTQIGLAGGAARLKVLENSAFEVQFEATLWGTIKELREVIALAESGRLSPIPIEFEPLDRINEVYARVKKGQVAGRAVIRPCDARPGN